MKKSLYIVIPIALLVYTLTFVVSTSTAFSAEDPSKPEVKNGECGPAKGDYWADEKGYRGDYCSKGKPSQTPEFPMPGERVEWQCTVSGGANSSCHAYRNVLERYPEPRKQIRPPKKETKKDLLVKNIKQFGKDFKRGLEIIGESIWPF